MKETVSFHRVIVALLPVCMVLFAGCERQPTEKRQVNVVFRYDDYSAVSPTDAELRIIEPFRKNEATITFSVIPFVCARDQHDPSVQDTVALTSEKADILKAGLEQGILEVAMHGYSHQTNNAEHMTEFSSLDHGIQLRRVAEGKKLLEDMMGSPVNVFVPPWNEYDLNTLRAIKEVGFSAISAAPYGEATEDSELSFIPATHGFGQVRDAVGAARVCSDTQPLIVVLVHWYDFKEVDKTRGVGTYQEFAALIDWLKSQKDVRLLSLGQATMAINDLSSKRFLLNVWARRISNLFPSSLRKAESLVLYRELSAFPTDALLKACGFYLVAAGLGAVFSLTTGMWVFRRYAHVMGIVTFESIAVSLIALIYACHDMKIHAGRLVASTTLVGISIGLCYLFLRTKIRGRNSLRTEYDEDYEDPLENPQKAFVVFKKSENIESEIELVEKYQSFVAEILRISLLAIACLAFLYEHMFKGNTVPAVAKFFAAIGLFILGLCPAFALWFRYSAIEGVRYYIEATRFRENESELCANSLRRRKAKIKWCILCKATAAICLGLGSALIGITFLIFFLQ